MSLRPWQLPLLLVLLAAPAAGRADDAVEARLRKDVTFLAAPEQEGRGVGTKGIDRAAAYIADAFAAAGLKPGGPKGDFFQPFPLTSTSELAGDSTVTLRGPDGKAVTLKQGADFQVVGLSGGGTADAPLVFVGHGATDPAGKYDDYKDVDVKGKVVVALRRLPQWGQAKHPFGKRKDELGSLESKQALAEAHGARAVILVNDASELPKDDLLSFQVTARALSHNSLPFVHVKRTVADDLLKAARKAGLRDVEQAIDRDLKPQSGPLEGWTAAVDVKVKRNVVTVKNVIGVLAGAGPLAAETVVVGAHYDHLGYGDRGSLAKGADRKAIHHGADDNASGTTALLELARRFAGAKERQGRRLVFIAFTAEESGLIGSRYYTKRQPLYPLKTTAAMFNLDMVGRLRPDPKMGKDKLLTEGSGTAKGFDKLLAELNPGFHLINKASGQGPSDHASFVSEGVPVLFFWTGTHDDYHRPTDTADKINVPGMARIVAYAEKVVGRLATAADRPQYVEVPSSFSPGAGGGPRLGIMPDYEGEEDGVLVAAVSKGGPADKGGLQKGDRIVELGGKAVKNINTYMAIMGQQRAGREVAVTVLRDGKKVQTKVTPQ